MPNRWLRRRANGPVGSTTSEGDPDGADAALAPQVGPTGPAEGLPPEAEGSQEDEADQVDTGPPDDSGATRRPLAGHPFVRMGAYAWALVGLVVALTGAALVLAELRIIVAPLVLALFPAALLAPLARRLMRHGLPPAAASLAVIVGGLAVVGGALGLLTPAIAAELPGVAESVRQGISELQAFLERGPFGIDPARIQRTMESVRAQGAAIAQQVAGTIATAIAEGVTGVLLALVVLFFYLKDGPRIGRWLRDLFPEHMRSDAQVIATQAWMTVGSYFRGQLLVALMDAVLIGLGLVLLGIPLALPLAVLVFVGGLFPIVGAVVSGAIAVLVGLADEGLTTALLVLGLIIVVQQLESNVFAPVVLGRATALHPLAIVLVITTGGVVLGVLGAFLAVPVAASLTRAVSYLRVRSRAGQEVVTPEATAPAPSQ